MFLYAEKITNLDLSSFDTSKVTTMFDMFNMMKSLTNLKFSKKFNTGQVQNMQGMFANLMNIQEIDLSQADFDTSNVTNFFGMFTIIYIRLPHPSFSVFMSKPVRTLIPRKPLPLTTPKILIHKSLAINYCSAVVMVLIRQIQPMLISLGFASTVVLPSQVILPPSNLTISFSSL